MMTDIKILYVDDEPINLNLFKINFRKKFDVITAESGYRGLELLKANPNTTVVISDMKMPGMNGIDFIRLAKKDFPAISFFILTGYDINDEIADALKENMIQKYFRKPFNGNEIELAIIDAVKK